MLFTVPLSASKHTVTVAFNGSQSGPPLDVNYFLVTSLTQAEQAPSLSNGSETSNETNGTSSGNESSSGSSSNATGHTEALILKAVLGSVVPVIFLVILSNIIWLRVGRRRREKTLNLLAAEPFAFEKPDSLIHLPLSKRPIMTGAFFLESVAGFHQRTMDILM